MGWKYPIEVVIDAPVDEVRHWIARSMGRLEALSSAQTRLLASTNDPYWYATKLADLRAPYRILGSAELQEASRTLGRRLLEASNGA